jgi:hypothetical protein
MQQPADDILKRRVAVERLEQVAYGGMGHGLKDGVLASVLILTWQGTGTDSLTVAVQLPFRTASVSDRCLLLYS